MGTKVLNPHKRGLPHPWCHKGTRPIKKHSSILTSNPPYIPYTVSSSIQSWIWSETWLVGWVGGPYYRDNRTRFIVVKMQITHLCICNMYRCIAIVVHGALRNISNDTIVNFHLDWQSGTNITILPHLSKWIFYPERIDLQNKSKQNKRYFTH